MDKVKVLSLMLHAADISHPAKAWPLHYRWTHSLMEEFFRQVQWETLSLLLCLGIGYIRVVLQIVYILQDLWNLFWVQFSCSCLVLHCNSDPSRVNSCTTLTISGG